MKKFLILAVLTGSIFFIAGCNENTEKRTSDAYYTFDGGIINLRHVKIITSGEDAGGYRVYISLDGYKVYYNSHAQRDDDLKIIIDKIKSL